MHEWKKRGINLLDKVDIKKLVIEVSPLLIILIGVALVAFSLGPYQSYDTQLEFEAASNVVKTGIPYVKAYGTAIDQPPLGFYIEAVFLRIFGLSANTGTALMTLFGLASTVAMYYGRQGIVWQINRIVCSCTFWFKPLATCTFKKLPP